MTETEILGLFITILGVGCFSVIFTVLYLNYSKSEIKDIKSGKNDIELIDAYIYENLSHVKVRRRIIRTIKSIVFYGLMVFIIPFFIISLIEKFNGNVMMINDKGILVVASGSMSYKHEENTYLTENNLNNQFDRFDLIVIERINDESDLKLYDVISFVNGEGTNIIHRIVDITTDESGVTKYVTRGDANGKDATDKFRCTIDDIQGKYVDINIPYIGMFILFMQSNLGMITIVALAYCLFMIEFITSKISKEQDKRLQKLGEAIDYKSTKETGNINAQYIETIYYKGFLYIFNEDGFIEKQMIEDDAILDKSKDTIIKVHEDKNTNESISTEFNVESENEEEILNFEKPIETFITDSIEQITKENIEKDIQNSEVSIQDTQNEKVSHEDTKNESEGV